MSVKVIHQNASAIINDPYTFIKQQKKAVHHKQAILVAMLNIHIID